MAKTKSKNPIKKTTSASKTKKSIKVIKKMRRTSPLKEITTKPSPRLVSIVKILLVIAVGVIVFLLIQKNIGLLLAGTVNKTPITRWELNASMAEKYGEQTLEEIVSEKLLAENLKTNKIEVTDTEVADELAKIKLQYGGEEQFQAAIAQFGMTEAKAKDSIKQSIGLRKLIESTGNIEITDEAVATYFEDNKVSYEGKTLEEVSAEIKEILYQQEIYTRSQNWYQEIRSAAQVQSYL